MTEPSTPQTAPAAGRHDLSGIVKTNDVRTEWSSLPRSPERSVPRS